MKKTAQQTLMAVAAVALGLCASFAQAQETPKNSVYAIDSRGDVVMSGSGLCVRTGFWTPAAAAEDPNGCKCDKDLMPANKCSPTGMPLPPGSKGAEVDNKKVRLAADTLFDFNKSTLRAEGKAGLDKIVSDAQALNLEVVIAVGHADRIGGDAYNQKLSERRAASVKAYLVSKGIPSNRVYAEGKGSKQPVTSADQCKGGKTTKVIACLQPDRRVDVEIIGTKK